MNIDIAHCGTHSIEGAIYANVMAKNLTPNVIVVNIGEVMSYTDVDKELAKAKKTFGDQWEILLGKVDRDCYKEALARNPADALCFS